MRIAVIGAGGVGGYYGALLARVGHSVTFFARGAHLAAIRASGLRVIDHDETFVVESAATDEPNELSGSELAIVAVKSYSLPEVTPAVALVARAGAVILPLLNGVDIVERLARGGVPAGQIIGGSTFVSASRVEPGVIRRHSRNERIVVGELNGRMTPRIETVAAALRSMGVNVVASPSIEVELWQKFAFICATAAACGMARRALGAIRETALGRLLLERAVGEIAAVARAKRIAIPDDQEAITMRVIDTLPPQLTPSFLLDLERGGATELDILSAAVARFGRELDVPTPIHDTAAAVLAPR